MSRSIAIIAGVGPGTGSAIAKRFARTYPIVLLARSQLSLDPVMSEINKSGGSAIGVITDVTHAPSMDAAVQRAKAEFGSDLQVKVAVYNVASKFVRAPFLEQSSDEFFGSLEPSVKGAYNFARATLPMMQGAGEGHPATLIFTGLLV